LLHCNSRKHANARSSPSTTSLYILILILLFFLLTRKSMQSRGRTPEELSTIAAELAKKKFELDTKLIIDIEARRKVSAPSPKSSSIS
jgi:hypothetical protein